MKPIVSSRYPEHERATQEVPAKQAGNISVIAFLPTFLNSKNMRGVSIVSQLHTVHQGAFQIPVPTGFCTGKVSPHQPYVLRARRAKNSISIDFLVDFERIHGIASHTLAA